MNREIKFRAWNKEEKRMWLNVGIDDGGCAILDTRNRGYKPLKGVNIIMQYTGLKDKNGKEIYEGDIVKRFEEDCGLPIIWRDDRACFEIRQPTSFILCPEYSERGYEVIGNIYENPELIKEA